MDVLRFRLQGRYCTVEFQTEMSMPRILTLNLNLECQLLQVTKLVGEIVCLDAVERSASPNCEGSAVTDPQKEITISVSVFPA